MTASRQLGEYLRRKRKALGLTQERLAELCDLTPEHISGIERGRRLPSVKTLLRMAEALNVSLPEAFQFQKLRPLTEKNRAITVLNQMLAKRTLNEIRYLTEMTKR